MKKVFRVVTLLLVLVTMLGIVPAPASAVEYGFDENFGWYWPTIDGTITSGFAVKRTIKGRTDVHQGIDIKAPKPVDVYAARSGKVYLVGEDNDRGKYICIWHGTNSNGKHIFSTYQHLSQILVKQGAEVNIGDKIAKTGATGFGSGPHLHFHVFRFDTDNPQKPSLPHGSYEVTIRDYVDITPRVNISVTDYPKEIFVGSGYGLRGVVSSTYNLSRVDGVIYNASGQPVMSATEWPNASSMDIRYSAINNKLIFNNLDVGSYTLKITATDVGGHTSYWEQNFTVKNQVTTISLHSVEVPTWLPKGKFFGLRGIYDSNYRITSVKGEIIKDGKTVQETMDYPYSKRFDVRYGNVNNQLHFNWLKRGTYTLRITVNLENGYTRVDSYTFHIY